MFQAQDTLQINKKCENNGKKYTLQKSSFQSVISQLVPQQL